MSNIEVQGIFKTYGEATAVKDLSFTVEQGTSLCLFGPSGCGKTTTLRLLAGLEGPDQGVIRIDGEVTNAPDETRPHHPGAVGMVFQDLALWPHMRAERHIDFVLRGVGLGRSERILRVNALLKTCCIDDKKRAFPSALSGGEQQRLALARALAATPPLLLLDEPLANLDDDLREHFLTAFQRRKLDGATIIFATHDREEADALADHVLHMADR